MDELVRFLDRVTEPAIAACRWVVTIVFAVMGVAMFTQIVLRSFGTTILMIEDMAIFGFFWLVFAGMAVAFRERQHVEVEFLMILLPERHQRFFFVVAQSLVILFLILLTLSGIYLTINNVSQHGMQLRISMAWVYFILPLASVAGILAVVSHLARSVREWKKEGNAQ